MKQEILTMEPFKPCLYALLFILPFMLGSSCSNEAEIDDGPVPFEVLREIFSRTQSVDHCEFISENIEFPGNTKDNDLNGLKLIIDSKSDFDTYISCEDSVSVNFGDEFVLAGKTPVHHSMLLIKNQAVEIEDGKLYYRVGIIESGAAVSTSASYIVKIQSRNYLKYPVVFDVYWAERF